MALAELVAARGLPDPVVLALPRGGVPVGLEVARRLRAPLDLVMVRKIGVPYQPELAAAAVVNGDAPEIVVNDEVAARAGLDRDDIAALAEVQLEEIRRRRALSPEGPYAGSGRGAHGDRRRRRDRDRRHHARGAEGGAAAGARPPGARGAGGSADTLRMLAAEVDDIVCVRRPMFLGAIGAYYLNFPQVDDASVPHARPGHGWLPNRG